MNGIVIIVAMAFLSASEPLFQLNSSDENVAGLTNCVAILEDSEQKFTSITRGKTFGDDELEKKLIERSSRSEKERPGT